MELTVYDIDGSPAGQVDVSDYVFGIEPSVPTMHQALVRQLANARAGTHDTLTRGEVRGGGRKPWRQKGTGRARQGSIRAPHWKGGGVVWGPHPRSYAQEMPKKMRRLAIRSALSAKTGDGQLFVIDGLSGLEPKTRVMREALAKLPNGGARKTVILTAGRDEMVKRGAGNLENVTVLPIQYVNMRDVIGADRVLLARDALEIVHQLWDR